MATVRGVTMRRTWLGAVGIAVPTLLAAQNGAGPYARIAVLRPLDGQTIEFEAGYLRHLEWHRQAHDPWAWYGWTIWGGDRYRWFVYATFNHSAASLDSAVAPADDERDNVLNVAPHVEWVTNGLYEFLPELSRGDGEPGPAPRAEFTVVALVPGAAPAFEAALASARAGLQDEALWYRMVAGGDAPRYVRLRPKPRIAAVLDERGGQVLPARVAPLVRKITIEIWTLRPAMSLGLPSPPRR
jgi:hypothetical protein